MIYCLYRVWRWRGLKRWITWLINQNNWVRNSRTMIFSTKILTSFVTWIKKSSKITKKSSKRSCMCECFVFWWFFDIIRWFSIFVEIFVDFDCFCIKLVIFMVTGRKNNGIMSKITKNHQSYILNTQPRRAAQTQK